MRFSSEIPAADDGLHVSSERRRIELLPHIQHEISGMSLDELTTLVMHLDKLKKQKHGLSEDDLDTYDNKVNP